MEIEKSITAVTGLVLALTGLLAALKPFIEYLKEIFKKRADNKTEPEKTLASPPITKLTKSRLFLIGALLLLAGGALIVFLLVSAEPFQIEIMKPTSTGPLAVKAVHGDDGKPNGDGEFPVEGSYSGDLKGNNLSVYVLIRVANQKDGAWYIQSPTEIVREDTWYRRGQWLLREAYVGRGELQNPLQSGETWDILAVIASSQIDIKKLTSVPSPDHLPLLKAQSKVLTVSIGNIVP